MGHPRRHKSKKNQLSLISPNGDYWLYGTHAVTAALANPQRKIKKLFCLKGKYHAFSQDLAAYRQHRQELELQVVEATTMDKLLGPNIVHQGVAALVSPLKELDITDIGDQTRLVLLLDHVTDPRNVGSILRSAVAFSCGGVIIQERHAPPQDGALAKTACGALEKIKLIRQVNLTRAIEKLKERQFWVVGLDARANYLRGQNFAGQKVALVLGAEGKGLRPLIRKHCDQISALYMPGEMESLNVSVAAVIGLYELVRPTN